MNTAWAIALLDGLAARGVRHAVVCPGSRSAPLALAAEHHPDIATRVAIDERGGAFHALGVAMATARPALAVTTSGTAVANLLPACIEAHQANIPLVLLSADRPPRLRETGANQTIRQPGIFSAYVRHEADLPLPSDDLEVARAAADAAAAAAMAWPPGPVHLNQPFDEPLAPSPDQQAALRALGGEAPRAAAGPLEARPAGSMPDVEPRMLGPRGLIVCGPGTPPGTARAAKRLASVLGLPVIADALSGIRFEDSPTIDGHDLFLGHPGTAAALRPDWIIQTGHSPTSKTLRRFLASHADVWRLKLDASGRGWNDIPGDVRVTDADPVRLLERLCGADPDAEAHWNSHRDPAWIRRWNSVDALAAQHAGDALARDPDAELGWVAPVLAATKRLFVGNSLPVRDLERVGRSVHDVQVFANRGASGIDGTIATAAGTAAGGGVVAVVGDVAFQHDVNSLALVPPHMRLVVVRNGGGRIFHHVPVSQATDHFERLFLTPPAIDPLQACAAFGIDAVAVPPSELAWALEHREAQAIILDVDGQRSAHVREGLEKRLHRELPELVASWAAGASP